MVHEWRLTSNEYQGPITIHTKQTPLELTSICHLIFTNRHHSKVITHCIQYSTFNTHHFSITCTKHSTFHSQISELIIHHSTFSTLANILSSTPLLLMNCWFAFHCTCEHKFMYKILFFLKLYIKWSLNMWNFFGERMIDIFEKH